MSLTSVSSLNRLVFSHTAFRHIFSYLLPNKVIWEQHENINKTWALGLSISEFPKSGCLIQIDMHIMLSVLHIQLHFFLPCVIIKSLMAFGVCRNSVINSSPFSQLLLSGLFSIFILFYILNFLSYFKSFPEQKCYRTVFDKWLLNYS